jgi:hypothetical protein
VRRATVSADFDTDLTRRLAALDEATAQVHLRGADAVRRRGRQRARRQTAGAVVATLAVVGIGVAVVTGLGDRAAEPVPVGPVPSVTLEPTPDGAAPAAPEVDPDPTGAWLQASDLPTDPYGQWTAEAEGDFVWDQAPPSPTWDNFPCAPTGEGLDVDVPVEADSVGAAARRFSVDGHQLTQYVLEFPDGSGAERAWDHVDQAGAPARPSSANEPPATWRRWRRPPPRSRESAPRRPPGRSPPPPGSSTPAACPRRAS